ncbi:MAG: PIN/TRAM domain-containing protein [Clostridia bacterium]|nr:PIN/TRAM domain-containing protein [Clostridia bacterium]
MRSRVARILMLGAGMAVGYFVYVALPAPAIATGAPKAGVGVLLGAMTGGGLAGLAATPLLLRLSDRIRSSMESGVRGASGHGIVAGAIGIIVGLIIANLFAVPVAFIPGYGTYIAIALNAAFGLAGLFFGIHKREEIVSILAPAQRRGREFRGSGARGRGKPANDKALPKILDTSVIIDGRIADIARSGFIEGTLVVPGFVLEELQHIADSSDVLKRNRGRRGLDILNRIQKDRDVAVQVVNKTFDDQEVDAKLIKLARVMSGTILTNDFNLNKVAELQGVAVLNINELANALKPVVLPGEEMTVHVIKDGKESGQGVAYLDDGTMVVVDGGRRHIGDSVGVLVTSVLQTSAGRMIFAKPKGASERAV